MKKLHLLQNFLFRTISFHPSQTSNATCLPLEGDVVRQREEFFPKSKNSSPAYRHPLQRGTRSLNPFGNSLKSASLILLCCLFSFLNIGKSQTNYFQQKVDYKINVSLNDEKHLLTGSAEITYQNNAPQALSEIYFHLWANAYQSKTSAFAKQKLRDRDVEFYFADQEELGGYEEIDFLVNGKKLNWDYDKEHRDIAKIKLLTPLASGESVSITIPFEVKIPNSYSRFGHVNTSYQMTQWYPKPAVFDQSGWHAMPYLDIGEFYSEFGNFDVTITLPKNYVVASTEPV